MERKKGKKICAVSSQKYGDYAFQASVFAIFALRKRREGSVNVLPSIP